MVKWIFDDEHGLLSSMDCRQDFVDLTSFILKPGAAASSHVEPTPVRIPRGALAASQATIGSQPGALLAPSQVRWLPARGASALPKSQKCQQPLLRRLLRQLRRTRPGTQNTDAIALGVAGSSTGGIGNVSLRSRSESQERTYLPSSRSLQPSLAHGGWVALSAPIAEHQQVLTLKVMGGRVCGPASQ